ARNDDDAVEIAGRAERFEHLFKHQAGKALPPLGREQLVQALFRIDRGFDWKQAEDHASAATTALASAFFRAIPVMIVSVTTARIPNFSTAAAWPASARSSTNTSAKSRYNSATPSAETRIPKLFIIRAAGPF